MAFPIMHVTELHTEMYLKSRIFFIEPITHLYQLCIFFSRFLHILARNQANIITSKFFFYSLHMQIKFFTRCINQS